MAFRSHSIPPPVDGVPRQATPPGDEPESRAHAPATAITIVNNSSHEIRHVYLSPPDQNNWGSDQLGSSVIAANGGSVTINASCDGASIKVIAEDNEGCFIYKVVTCSESVTWTITSDAARDCGN